MFLKIAKVMLTALFGLYAISNLWGIVRAYQGWYDADMGTSIFWSFIFVMLTFFCIGKFFGKKKPNEKD